MMTTAAALDADFEMIVAAMRDEFLTEARDKLEEIDDRLDAIDDRTGIYANHVLEVQRLVHSLKGQAGSFGFSSVSRIAHAFEDYIEIAGTQSRLPVPECRVFVSVMANILNSGREPDDEEAVMLIDSLPMPLHPGAAAGRKLRGKAIVLMPAGLQRKIMAQELVNFGFRVLIADDEIEVIDLALSGLPDLVVTSMRLGRMSGLDVARALTAIERTAHIKVAIMTADMPAASTDLPDSVGIIRKGPTMARDFIGWMRTNGFA